MAPVASAQDFYYSDERKIPIEQAEQWKVIQISEGPEASLVNALSRQPDVDLQRVVDSERGFYWLKAKSQQSLSEANLDKLSETVPI